MTGNEGNMLYWQRRVVTWCLSDQTPSSGLTWRLFGELPKRTLKELSRFSLSYTAQNELLFGLRRDD